MILETLQDNKSLTELKAENCALSIKGTYASVAIATASLNVTVHSVM